MFDPQSSFHVDGKALGFEISVDLKLCALGPTDATAAIQEGRAPLVVDIVNLQAMLVSAITSALIRIQAMETGLGGASVEDIRAHRQQQPAVEAVLTAPSTNTPQ